MEQMLCHMYQSYLWASRMHPTGAEANKTTVSPHNEMHFINVILLLLYVALPCAMLRYNVL